MWLPSEKASLSLTRKLFFSPQNGWIIHQPSSSIYPLHETKFQGLFLLLLHCKKQYSPVIWGRLECCAKLPQSCPTLCDTMDCSPPDSSVRGILQARILEWVAMLSSRGSSKNPCLLCLLHCKLILYHWATGVLLSYWGNPMVGRTQD